MNKWKMNRAGLLNFWYYDEEVFQFSNGKLLLRGSNGSGKSVTMQSFLPVLLDGKKTPDRLDPFGSKARRMEDYLLGEKEVVNRGERTGYLYLEFKRDETDQYITIGIGLQAKRNKQMKFWGFVLTDNRRIGTDFNLYKFEKHAGKEQKIPRSRIELENLIGEGGQVVQTQGEYKELVNKHLFGFETLEAYDDLIKLLIQIRSPKLSKDFKPTVIYEILEAALPPLSDDDLRHLSDTIEQMDQTKQQIEQLERESAAIQTLNRVYTTYNQRISADLAHEFLQASKRLEKEQHTYQEQQTEKDRLEEEIGQLEKEITESKQQLETYQKQEERLRSHKVWNLEKERQEETDRLQITRKDFERKDGQLNDRRKKERKLNDEKQDLEEQSGKREEEVENYLLDLGNDAADAAFEQHELNQQDFIRHRQESFDFTVWNKEVHAHLTSLESIEKQFQLFEDLKKRYQDKDKELAEESRKLEEARQEEQSWLNLFHEDKDRKLSEIHSWIERMDWLAAGEEAIQDMSRGIYSLYEPTEYETIRAPFRQLCFDYEQQRRKQLAALAFQEKQLDKQISETEENLKEWKDKEDPEPAMDPATKQARNRLSREGISYIPFYAAVEFQNHVEAGTRNRLEAAMLDSGILDALIAEEDIPLTHDRLLKAEPRMLEHTLADYLKPDIDETQGISAVRVEEILQSILMEEEGTNAASISEQGCYKLGILRGHAIPVENARYIGRTARKRFREEQILLLEEELAAQQIEKQTISKEIKSIKEDILRAKTEMDQFPDDEDLQEVFRSIERVRVQIRQYTERGQQLSEELKNIHQEYVELKWSIDQQANRFNLESSRSAYQEAITVMKRYEKDLFSLEKEQIKYVHEQSRLYDISSQLAELEEVIVELQGELNVLQDRIHFIEKNLSQIKLQLEKQGVADIRREIEEVQLKLREIGGSLDKNKQTLPRKETKRDHLFSSLDQQKKTVAFWMEMEQAWKFTFRQELSRGLVFTDMEGEMKQTARRVYKEYGFLLKEKDASKLAGQLTQEFFKQQSDLMEYRMNSYQEPATIPEWMEDIENEEQQLHIGQWKNKRSRTIIELDYQGKQVSPYTIQQELENEYLRQESLLNEQDQALYEEILFKSVGNKLRARIHRAEQWASKMNVLMESSDTSSGLSFSIKWKPRTADSEAEMDTVDLVKLLKQDAKLLKEEDLDKITGHFRSKIKHAKEMLGEGSEMQTLLQVLKEVLDYRKWFSFVLSYRREREPKRELTNNAFYKFSGGEKAMAMYIPLFTACYSRYQEAAPSAPYIISLDEAFAGVDENNIREMFEIVEQLGFDYMMNSQVLWGDYDTISSLSICELVRPKNADYVSVLRYRWDGNKIGLELPDPENEAAAGRKD